MKKNVLIGAGVIAFLFICLLSAESSYAQSKEISSAKVEKSRGAAQKAMPDDSKPAAKPDKSRGACCIEFDNYTGYYIDVWVDNVYRGRLSPWDVDSLCVGDGFTSWYAETAGGTFSWTDSGSCNGMVSYRLK